MRTNWPLFLVCTGSCPSRNFLSLSHGNDKGNDKILADIKVFQSFISVKFNFSLNIHYFLLRTVSITRVFASSYGAHKGDMREIID